jgi:hypothetical protein
MSHQEHYFDEQATTARLAREFIVVYLRNEVDLDSELHITNLQNEIGGIYRVAWTKDHPGEDWYTVGLELLDSEGEIWEADSIIESQETGEGLPEVTLACRRCKGTVTISVPEAETESLGEGFALSRHCDTCKATTGWNYVVEKPREPEALSPPAPAVGQAASPAGGIVAPAAAAPNPSGRIENREKGRAPIRMAIKVTRNKYGRNLSDIGETINVSRTGAYFTTEQNYEPGESVEIILPYHPNSVAIPVPARVVRLDKAPDSYQKRVAVHLAFGTNTGR